MVDVAYTNQPIEMLEDEDRLVRRAQSGDADAFAQLYDASVDHVYRYITCRVENDRVAEAVTIRAFFKAWDQLGRYHGFGSSIIAWLYSIARNEIIAYYRTHKRTANRENSFALMVEGRYLDEEVQDMFDMQAMRDGLQFLTEEEQQVLILKFIVGLPTKNIARIVSKREEQVRAVQFRALQRLTSYLKEKEII
jgi:RNA polymerase sigma-70 factor, ECF subfamily